MKMFRGSVVVGMLVIALSFMASVALADMSKEDIIAKAKDELANKGIVAVDCDIMYDEGNKSWKAWGEYVENTPEDNNYGNLPKGILEGNNYQAVYFDFSDDAKKDIWVFVDSSTGDVLAVYEKK